MVDPVPYQFTPDPAAEVWRPVVSHPTAYEVSDLGRVHSVARVVPRARGGLTIRARILKTCPGGRVYNYLRVHLYTPERFAFVHCLVAESFLGPRPEGAVILHLTDDGHDNRACHLRYGTPEENETDKAVNRWNEAHANAESAPF